jgi:hypothetical protein
MILPLKMMWDRVELARGDSDTTLFLHLLYAGEMLMKLVTASLVAAVTDDREGHRYRLTHRLIRSDGLGDWAQTLDEVLVGPPAQHLLETATEDQRSLAERFRSGTWQYEAVDRLFRVVGSVAGHLDPLPVRVPLRQWFAGFVTLRNSTRGHGATTPETCGKLALDLEQSIELIRDNLPVLQRPWAYLHRNLSGKFRIVPLGEDTSSFDQLKTITGASTTRHRNLSDGVYADFCEYYESRSRIYEHRCDGFFLPKWRF